MTRTMNCITCSDMECVKSDGEKKNLPMQFTLCIRYSIIHYLIALNNNGVL